MSLGNFLFKIRGYTPAPFLVIGIIAAEFNYVFLLAGITTIFLGEWLRVLSVSYAGKSTRSRKIRSPRLVTTGPFAYSRNPIYIGNVLIYAGMTLVTGAYFPYLLISILLYFSIQYHFIVGAEEVKLYELFGEDYKKYKESVPRFIPNFNSSKSGQQLEKDIMKALKSERSTFLNITIFFLSYLVKITFYA